MLEVRQTVFDLVNGNCFAACIASIFEVPLESVPQCIAAEDWWDRYQEWFAARGLYMVSIEAAWKGFVPRGYCILGGFTHKRHTHCVVALDGRAVWDPLGCEPSIEEPVSWIIFAALDVSKIIPLFS